MGFKKYVIAFILFVVTLGIYAQVFNHPFVNYDDDLYVYANPVVERGLTLEGVCWAFTTFHAANWHPLTWISHMLDTSLFGLDPGLHHLISAIFHAMNASLLFIILFRMTAGIWQSALVAALFAVHPLHVESVAWVAERKDVLSGFFFLLVLWAYARYCDRPTIRRYIPVFLFLALGLMAKPMLVTVPFLLLVLDWWPLRRSSGAAPASRARLLYEKVPLLGLSAASCVITYIAQKTGDTVQTIEVFSFSARIANSLFSYAEYLLKTVWPINLAVIYPHPASYGAGIPLWGVAGAGIALVLLTTAATWQMGSRPWIAAGWMWYLGMLVPVIGLVQVGSQAIADRYTYLPLIGIFMAVAWSIPFESPWKGIARHATALAVGIALVAFSVLSWSQLHYWQSPQSLFSHALAATENNWVAWDKLGNLHMAARRYGDAISCYESALRINSSDFYAWNNLGVANLNMGNIRPATDQFRMALAKKPDYAKAHYNLGNALEQQGLRGEAIAHFREALRLNPDYSQARIRLEMLSISGNMR